MLLTTYEDICPEHLHPVQKPWPHYSSSTQSPEPSTTNNKLQVITVGTLPTQNFQFTNLHTASGHSWYPSHSGLSKHQPAHYGTVPQFQEICETFLVAWDLAWLVSITSYTLGVVKLFIT